MALKGSGSGTKISTKVPGLRIPGGSPDDDQPDAAAGPLSGMGLNLGQRSAIKRGALKQAGVRTGRRGGRQSSRQ